MGQGKGSLSQYSFGEELGRGAFGIAYKAVDKKNNDQMYLVLLLFFLLIGDYF